MDTTSTVLATLMSTGAPRVCTRGRLSLLTSPLLPTTPLVAMDTTSMVPATLTSTGAPRVCTREAEPSYKPALAYHPAGGYGYHKYGPGYSYEYRSPQGLHKREADASEPHYEPALAYHPAGGYGYHKYGPGYSYEYRSPQGLHKREAEPSYKPALAYHPAGGYG